MKTNLIVKKSNKLINAKYKLGINEQKILYLLISQIHMKDNDFETYEIKTTDLIKFLGTKSNTIYEDIERYTYNLMKEVLIIKKETATIQTNWFTIVEHTTNNKILFSFHPILKPYLLNLKDHFTRFKLENIRNFKGKYTPRIYELLKESEYKGFREISIDELRKLLMLEKSYMKYNDFKKDIIIKAQKEINTNSDIVFTFDEIKNGRKIVSIKFFIKCKNKDTKNICIPMVKKENIDISNNNIQELSEKIKDVINDTVKNDKIIEWIEEKKESDIEFYLKNWIKWSWKKKDTRSGFFIDLVDYKRPVPKGEDGIRKPIQATNYEQREYDDDFYYKHYDNVQFIKNKDGSRTIKSK